MGKYIVRHVREVWDLLRNRSMPKNSSILSSTVDLRDVIRLALTVRVTYDALAAAGITVYIYTSPDDKDLDTDELTSFEPSFTAGATVQKTVYIDPDAQEIQCKITNKDTDDPVTKVDLRATLTKEVIEND